MEEKVLNKKKNGMAMMLLFIALYIAAAILMCIGVDHSKPLCVVSVIYLGIGWIPFLGLKVLKPQEALVLTLFGNYVGTLKEAGFYFVNPFCTAVNPAAATKLNQSGIDAPTGGALSSLKISTGTTGEINAAQAASKKVSLKIMTLNNNRQITIRNTCPCNVTVPCVTSYVFILMMYLQVSIRQGTVRPMRAVFAVPVKSLPSGSVRKFRKRLEKPVLKLSKPGLPILPMLRKLLL